MCSNATELWQRVLLELEPLVSAVNFDVWLITLNPVSINDNRLVLCAANASVKNFVESKFSKDIKKALLKVEDCSVEEIVLIVPLEKDRYELDVVKEEEGQRIDNEEEASERIEAHIINPKFNFENFVVGGSNQFMYAAAQAVAQNPGTVYNPLFIYGGTGLGKTHIMHAIGNYAYIHHKKLKVYCVSSEKFLTDFIASIVQKKKNSQFKDKYRDVDILMIDDIQFISGKPGVQEELFHTFNELASLEKQIVFTSDRPPREIRDLEERLQSRFEGGLMADVQQPDLETRIAILQKKAAAQNFNLKGDVLSFIASELAYSNIRELEGLLNRVIFLSKLYKKVPTIEMVREAKRDGSEKNEDSISAEQIIECVCRYYKIAKDNLIGKKKIREFSEPRQISMYLIIELLGLPLAKVGESFSGRDHTTVMHAKDKIASSLLSNPSLRMAIDDIKGMIYNKG